MILGHYNLTILIALIVILYLGLNWLFDLIKEETFKKFQPPSVISSIAIILILINNFLWDCKIINPILIDVPKISGKYEGFVNVSHNDTSLKEKSPVNVEIKQSGTSTYFDLYSKKGSHSKSIITQLIKSNGIWNLYQIYSNENYSNPDNINRYEGTCKLEVLVENDSIILKGRFYTDNDRKSFGTVYLKKVSI